MLKVLGLVGSVAGGYMGWFVGAPVCTMTAFMVSVVGSGAGLWAGRRLAQRMLD